MAIVGSPKQQPNDVQDYDIDFSEWFPPDDTIVSASIDVYPSMPIPCTFAIKHPRIKVWVYEGGTSGIMYKITVTAKTNDGRIKEVELKIRMKAD